MSAVDAQGAHVVVLQLPDAARSGLEPLGYAARGIYCVRSRTAECERVGLGLPARSAEDRAT